MKTKLDWARWLAARDVPVFPLPPNGTVPSAEWEGWPELATTDPAKIRAWWEGTDCNIAACTTGFLVADLDMKDGKNGVAAWMALHDNEGGFDTLTVKTKSGGYHLYYSGADVAQSIGKLSRGLDIKSHNNYVVGPGSVVDGVAYEVLFDRPIAPAPPHIVAMCKPPGKRAEHADIPLGDLDGPADVAAAVERVSRTPGAVRGEQSENAVKLACAVRDFGVSEDKCNAIMQEWAARCSPPIMPEDLARRVANAYAYAQNRIGSRSVEAMFRGVTIEPPEHSAPSPAAAPAPPPPPPISGDVRPVIRVVPGVDAIATQAEDALLQSGLPIYQRDKFLVRPMTQEVAASDGRKVLAAGLQQLDAYSLTDLLSRAATWIKHDGRRNADVRTDPPQPVAKIILSRAGQWRVPVVAGVITTPTLRPDGTILAAPGYDDATRLYLAADPGLEVPDDGPLDRGAAERALDDLAALLTGFPFVSEVSRAVALSALISPVVRGALSAVPLHVFRASTAGTGKSYLADVASTIATGRPCPVMAAAAGREGGAEDEKRLVSFLLGGTPIISIDNVNGELGGDLLCQIVERPLVTVRRLGVSNIIEVENRATVFATGNNLRVRGDMVRRTLICDLDAGVERPELRAFTFDPVQKVLLDRARHVGACLTVVRAYLAAGTPAPRPPVASFGDWSRLVRSALVWLGCADPADAMEAAREDDPELEEHRAVASAWMECVGDAPVAVRDVIAKALGHTGLFDALMTVAGDGRAGINAAKLGKWLAGKQGRIVAGLAFRRDGINGHEKVIRWRCARA